MKWICAIVVSAGLAGCSGGTFDAGELAPPPKWVMAKKCPLPQRPADDGDPVVRADYEAKLRRCAARRGDQVDGLQSYARTATQR